jgi:hypothetical protein
MNEELVTAINNLIGSKDAPLLIGKLVSLGLDNQITLVDYTITLPKSAVPDIRILQEALQGLSKTERIFKVSLDKERVIINLNHFTDELHRRFNPSCIQITNPSHYRGESQQESKFSTTHQLLRFTYVESHTVSSDQKDFMPVLRHRVGGKTSFLSKTSTASTVNRFFHINMESFKEEVDREKMKGNPIAQEAWDSNWGLAVIKK